MERAALGLQEFAAIRSKGRAMRNSASRVIAASAALILAAQLSGCSLLSSMSEGPPYEPIVISRSGDDLLFAICGNLLASRVLVDQRDVAADHPWRPISAGDVALLIESGVPVSTGPDGPLPPGDAEPAFEAGEFSVQVTGQTESGELEVPEANFELHEPLTEDKGWLHQDGSYTETPCEGEPIRTEWGIPTPGQSP